MKAKAPFKAVSYELDGETYHEVEAACGSAVAYIDGGYGATEAQVLASAPTLLAACKTARNWMGPQPSKDTIQSVLKKLDAAIRAAEEPKL